MAFNLFGDRIERVSLASGGKQSFEDLVSVLVRAGRCAGYGVGFRSKKIFDRFYDDEYFGALLAFGEIETRSRAFLFT